MGLQWGLRSNVKKQKHWHYCETFLNRTFSFLEQVRAVSYSWICQTLTFARSKDGWGYVALGVWHCNKATTQMLK